MMTTNDTSKQDAEHTPVTKPVPTPALNTGSPMDDEPEPGTDPMHEGP